MVEIKKRSLWKKALLVSLFLHLCLLVGILGWNRLFPTSTEAPSDTSSTLIVTVGPSTGGSTDPKSGGPARPSKKQRSASPSDPSKKSVDPLKDFGVPIPGIGPPRGQGKESGGTESEEEGSSNFSDGYGTAEKMDLKKETDLYPFFEAVWKQIDRSVGYPDEFTSQHIEGHVEVQFWVTPEGRFSGKFVSLSSSEPILQTYVMAALIQGLREPIPPARWNPLKKELIVVADFQFKVRIRGTGGLPNMDRDTDPTRHFKNIFSFKRTSFVDPKLNQEIEEALNKYVPPIIPLPGGFYIDFLRAYQMVKNIGKPSPREIRERKLQVKKEELERLIQN